MENKEKVNKLCGTRLREARRAKDLTQQQLADIVEVDPKYISAIENGKRKMSSNLAKKVGKTLNARPEYLLGLDDHPTAADELLSKKYTGDNMYDYIEYLEQNDYILSTPFGDDGDTASLTFLATILNSHVISHGDEHYKCSSEQLHTFFKNTHSIIENMKLMLVRQFLETAYIKLTDEELKAEMKNMEQLFQDSFGETGQAWLEEQRKFDVCDFDGMDKDRWQDALTKMSTMPLQQFTSPSDVKKIMQAMWKLEEPKN